MEKKIETMSLFMETAGFAPPITGEEICSSLRMVANHLEAIIPNGRNAWEVVCRAGDVATGLEVTGLVLRGRNVELSQRFPGGTWVRVRGLPLDAADLTVRCVFENFGEVVSGPHHVMWRGTTIKTGNRTLKVKLVREIPQSFTILGGKTKVTVRYRDQPKTCFSCGATGHERRDCPTHDESTYAQAVANPPTDAVAVAQTDALENTPRRLQIVKGRRKRRQKGEKEGGKRKNSERWIHRSANPRINGRTSRRPRRPPERVEPRTVGCHRGHPLTSSKRSELPDNETRPQRTWTLNIG